MRKVKVRFVPKSRKTMKDVIADHYLANRKIPKGQVWVRSDWWRHPEKRKRIITHEKVELNLMHNKKMPYKKAHRIANVFERNVLKVLRQKKKRRRKR